MHDDTHLSALRPYQREAVLAVERALAEDGNSRPVVKAATGAGKSVMIAALALRARDRGERVLILAHREELIRHNAAACDIVCRGAGRTVGLMLASANRRQTSLPITVGMIQTAASHFKRPRPHIRPWDMVIIDEAHRVPLKKPNKAPGQYQTLLAAPQMEAARIVGLTATPSRLGEGPIYLDAAEDAPEMGDWLPFTHLVYERGLSALVADGFLVPMRAVAGRGRMDMSGVKLVAGEYNQAGMAAAAMAVLPTTIADILERGRDRHMWLIFSANVAHGEAIASALAANGITAQCITGETGSFERRGAIEGAKSGKIRALVSCEVLTTGTDIPRCDFVVLARATKSPELYVQMVGRGARLCPETGKTDCLVLDIGGNVSAHGEPDSAQSCRKGAGAKTGEAPMKICEDRSLCVHCRYDMAKAPERATSCPGCGGALEDRVEIAGCFEFVSIGRTICAHCLGPFAVPARQLQRDTFEGERSLVQALRDSVKQEADAAEAVRRRERKSLRDMLKSSGAAVTKRSIVDYRR